MATETAPQRTCSNFIDGQWIVPNTAAISERRNPADLRDLLGHAPLSGRDEIRQAIAAATRAFPAWRDTPAPTRGKVLMRVARLLEDQRDDIARLLTREEGKPLADAVAELTRAINCVEYSAGEARRLAGETLPSELHRKLAWTFRQPLGVVGIITPWNFPASTPLWKIAPALACGNTVVWKPSELTPFITCRLTEIFIEADLPAGVLNVVHGTGQAAGSELVEHAAVSAISFTGSTAVGTQIYARAAQTKKKVQCEMGGKNPFIVLEDADLEAAADAVVWGAFGSTGQRCTATSRVIVLKAIADRFAEMVCARANQLKVGNGIEPNIQVGPSVDKNHFDKVHKYLEIGKREGMLLCGGSALTATPFDQGYFTAPSVFDHVDPQARIAQEEIFGPVLSLIRVDDFEQAIQVANAITFGLSASLYTRDLNRALEFIERSECGVAHVNAPTVGGEAHLPFGGHKDSGIGEPETGSAGIHFFSKLKVVYVDYQPNR